MINTYKTGIETTNPFVKATRLPDNHSETDNGNTVDNGQNSLVATKQRENNHSKVTL